MAAACCVLRAPRQLARAPRQRARSGSASAGYQGFGSFHSDNVEKLVRDPDFTFHPPVQLEDLLATVLPGSAGRALRRQEFLLDDSWTFLNHGAFGGPARVPFLFAQRWRAYAELQPLRHIDRVLLPAMVSTLREVAPALGCGHAPEQLVPLPNVTAGLNAALESMAGGGLGSVGPAALTGRDAVVTLSVGYGSVKHMVKRLAHRTGAAHVEVQVELPTRGRRWHSSVEAEATLVGALEDALQKCSAGHVSAGQAVAARHPKLVVLDHVTSNTGMVLPLEALCRAAKRHGVDAVLVDGAHGPGQALGGPLAEDAGDGLLDLRRLEQAGVDLYVGNFHKWCCAPRGAAFLWAAPAWHGALYPPVLSHGAAGGFLERFIWDGARDYSAQLAAPAALHFWARWAGTAQEGAEPRGTALRRGLAAMAGRCSELRAEAAALLSERWGTEPLLPPEMHGSMALVRVPARGRTSSDAKRLQDWLHHEHAIECPVKCLDGELFVRISAHVYNELEDYERLALAVQGADWL